jgi:hypothetical protein
LLKDHLFISPGKRLTMKSLNVFLFSQSTSGDGASLADQQRLQAMKALRDELLTLGIGVSAAPQDTDLQVEIVHVLGIEDGPLVRSATDASHLPERPRTLVVRVSADAELHSDLVCPDGMGNMTAERQAARRIQAWLCAQMNTLRPHEAHTRDAAWAGEPTTVS